MIAALYVDAAGVYAGRSDIDPWDIERDARLYAGNDPVVAHPPCTRWSAYGWRGSLLRSKRGEAREILGDDKGCFAHALWAVRTFGGIIEHPAYSYAFPWFGLPVPKPPGWTKPDVAGGRSCLVFQRNWGHDYRKATWLYACGTSFPGLDFSKPEPEGDCEAFIHKKNNEHKKKKATPPEFAELLITIARSALGKASVLTPPRDDRNQLEWGDF